VRTFSLRTGSVVVRPAGKLEVAGSIPAVVDFSESAKSGVVGAVCCDDFLVVTTHSTNYTRVFSLIAYCRSNVGVDIAYLLYCTYSGGSGGM